MSVQRMRTRLFAKDGIRNVFAYFISAMQSSCPIFFLVIGCWAIYLTRLYFLACVGHTQENIKGHHFWFRWPRFAHHLRRTLCFPVRVDQPHCVKVWGEVAAQCRWLTSEKAAIFFCTDNSVAPYQGTADRDNCSYLRTCRKLRNSHSMVAVWLERRIVRDKAINLKLLGRTGKFKTYKEQRERICLRLNQFF